MDQIYFALQPDAGVDRDVTIDEKPSDKPVELRASTQLSRAQLLRALRAIKNSILRGNGPE